MTGTKTMRASHGRYVSAGYACGQEQRQTPQGRDLYIADDPAGSAREKLRDLNRAGYRGEDEETPSPALQTPEARRPDTFTVKKAAKKQRPMGPVDRLIYEVRRDRAGVTVCVLLAATMLVMCVAWGRNMVAGVNAQRSIENYQKKTVSLQKENEAMTQQLESAESGERIRNRAQNELGMLRRERAQTETIYIQAPDKKAREEAQAVGQTHMEILDFLLGLLNVFHIGE